MLLRELYSNVPISDNIDERRSEFRDFLTARCLDPTVDPSTQQFIETYIERWEHSPVINALSDIMLSREGTPDHQYIAEFLPRAFVALMLRSETNQNYLYETGSVLPAFDLLENTSENQLYISLDIQRGKIQSNIGDREWLLSLVLQANGLTDDRPIIEYGTSTQAIGKKLTAIATGHMEHHTVAMYDRHQFDDTSRIIANPVITALMKETVERPINAPSWLGLDLFNPEEPAVQNWVRACSQYLSDWTNEAKRKAFDALQAVDAPNVRWANRDFSTFTLADYKDTFPSEDLPRAIYIPYSLYELGSETERKRTLDQATEIANAAEGVVVVLDDIKDITADNVATIAPRKRDFSTCGGWVYNAKNPEAGFQKYFSFDGGRLQKAIPESGLALTGLLSVR